ncbi:hypothetical protein [Ornithinimicrobium cryptoxanthini]|uniref:hypothetical protein n=1 Tax=Ornithinimicrobium cryptoxanthini TaxID=2934161 RepID=UPI00211758FE|nr:hypothetical protein [Ornithinimicrobium cryptoxanthini]
MTTPDAVLAQVPDDLLKRPNAPKLVRWLQHRGHRPTLLALEQERTRRGINRGTNQKEHTR